jgi:type I restriction enzyme R subunit
VSSGACSSWSLAAPLAAHAVRAFASFEAEPGQKFDAIYETYSGRFQREDFGEEEKFDSKLLPPLIPDRSQARQRLRLRLYGSTDGEQFFGPTATFGDEVADDDISQMDIPIHALDVVVADECHRGYTEQSI